MDRHMGPPLLGPLQAYCGPAFVFRTIWGPVTCGGWRLLALLAALSCPLKPTCAGLSLLANSGFEYLFLELMALLLPGTSLAQ